DVDAHVDGLAGRQPLEHSRGPAAAVLGNGQDVVAPGARVLDVGLARAQAPDADLHDRADGGELRHVPDGVAVGPLHAVHEGPVVEVGVEVHHVETVRVGADDRIRDGVVAADDDGQGARLADLPDIAGDVVEG